VSTADAPLSGAPWPSAPPGTAGLKFGFPEARRRSPPPHRFSHRLLIALLVAGLAVLSVVLVVVAVVATPGPPAPCPLYQCQGPPIGHPGKTYASQANPGPPVANGTLYTNRQGFSLRFSLIADSFPKISTAASGIGFEYDFASKYGGTADFYVQGGQAGGSTAQSLVSQIVSRNFPNAQPVYEMPQPLVGYQPGFGEAYNVEVASSDGTTQTSRILVLAAVQNGFAIVIVADGSFFPQTASSPLFNGHASPADVNVAYVVDPIIDSIHFP
jgi:hypothetical protein